MRKMAAMAESHFITMAPHSGSLGPVAEFAALHVLATIPNVLMLERVEIDWEGRYDVVPPVLRSENGILPLPTAPGLGVELVEEEIAKYPSSRNVTDMPANEGAYEPGTSGECVYFQPRLRRGARLRLKRSDGV